MTDSPIRKGQGRTWAKAILLGEHSVVYGHPAVAVPLHDLQMQATATPVSGPSTLNSLGYHGPMDESGSHFACVVRAFDAAREFAGCPGQCFEITTHSDFPHERGLGSSAAAAGAVIRAVLDACQRAASAVPQPAHWSRAPRHRRFGSPRQHPGGRRRTAPALRGRHRGRRPAHRHSRRAHADGDHSTARRRRPRARGRNEPGACGAAGTRPEPAGPRPAHRRRPPGRGAGSQAHRRRTWRLHDRAGGQRWNGRPHPRRPPGCGLTRHMDLPDAYQRGN